MITLTWPMGQLIKVVAAFFRALGLQLLFITPLFWCLELSQNVAWRWVNGDWGWVYPGSTHHWFSFSSLGLWAGAVALLWVLHTFWFQPWQTKAWQRIITSTLLCWMGEWFVGFLAAEVFNTPFLVWPGTQLVYVSFSALFFWLGNVLIYHLLTQKVTDLNPAFDATSDA